MFNKVLIANRGEIACRVAATCRHLGIASVAVYSDADASSKHVAACDEAVHIGGSAASDSYLRIERIVTAARVAGAEAIHPGYGFLSENEAFALACEAAGIVFIGPPVEALAAMGSKAMAKALMHTAAVPLVPGYHGEAQDAERLQREADAIGYPVLLKASAGGGGKGMRVVEKRQDFIAALLSCRREAASSFGDDRLLIEKYVQCPRHVEVQVFGDRHDNIIYLLDRDCSVQRRHQKVLEEAPAPNLTAAQRQAMGEAAVAAARAVRYVGAGTVEFIVADGVFYFMEMNTRLQVEHPVTEMITGLDLVEWQLRIAAGGPLPLQQSMVRAQGHAIEARIYAENPASGFLPSTGILKHLRFPTAVEFVVNVPIRIDSGVREGDAITPFYDPMIAKLIVWGADRGEALARMARALEACEIAGLHTNVEFLQRVVTSQSFIEADLDTGLIERCHEALCTPLTEPREAITALACAALFAREQLAMGAPLPWTMLANWRLNAGYRRTLEWRAGDATLTLCYTDHDGKQTLALDGVALPFAWARGVGLRDFSVVLDGRRLSGHVYVDGDVFHVFCQGCAQALEWRDPLAYVADEGESEGRLTAPMPGRIVAVLIEPGCEVDLGAPLIVMEAMKMEHTISAPIAGVVAEVLYAVGDQVTEGAQLLVMA